MLATGMMMGGRPVFDITIASNGGTWRRTIDAPQIARRCDRRENSRQAIERRPMKPQDPVGLRRN
jgi:hypothetical protein